MLRLEAACCRTTRSVRGSRRIGGMTNIGGRSRKICDPNAALNVRNIVAHVQVFQAVASDVVLMMARLLRDGRTIVRFWQPVVLLRGIWQARIIKRHRISSRNSLYDFGRADRNRYIGIGGRVETRSATLGQVQCWGSLGRQWDNNLQVINRNDVPGS